jgi:hypothetical protein
LRRADILTRNQSLLLLLVCNAGTIRRVRAGHTQQLLHKNQIDRRTRHPPLSLISTHCGPAHINSASIGRQRPPAQDLPVVTAISFILSWISDWISATHHRSCQLLDPCSRRLEEEATWCCSCFIYSGTCASSCLLLSTVCGI